MEEFWILILVAFLATNSLDKAESVKLELKSFDEIFGEGWWDKGKAEDLKTPPTQNEHNSPDQLGQIEPNSTDQNPPPLTESDHSENAKNIEEQREIMNEITSNEKRKIINKFHAMKDEFKQKGKYSAKEWSQIGNKIAKHLKVNRTKIFEWKKELGLSQRNPKNERKTLIEKFDQRKDELKRGGFKSLYKCELDKTVAKELGITDRTIYKWKRELRQTAPKHKYGHNEQKELIKRYYEIKDQNPKISDKDIAKQMLNIGRRTLYKWKKHFKRQ